MNIVPEKSACRLAFWIGHFRWLRKQSGNSELNATARLELLASEQRAAVKLLDLLIELPEGLLNAINELDDPRIAGGPIDGHL